MSDTKEPPRPRGPNGGRRRKRRQGESPVWVDEEERRGKAAAMRGHPQPVSGRYQLFAEKMMGQQRLSLGDAKLLPGGEAEDAVGPLVPHTQPMASIICCTECGARPYPPPGFREDFDLMKLSSAGRPAEGGEGEWYCSRHVERLGSRAEPPFRIVKETESAGGACEGLRPRHERRWRR